MPDLKKNQKRMVIREPALIYPNFGFKNLITINFCRAVEVLAFFSKPQVYECDPFFNFIIKTSGTHSKKLIWASLMADRGGCARPEGNLSHLERNI